jgi:hypothetical protein
VRRTMPDVDRSLEVSADANAGRARAQGESTDPEAEVRSYIQGIDLPAAPEATRAHWVTPYPQCPNTIGRTGQRLTRLPQHDRAYWVTPYPMCPNTIGHTG